MRNLIFAYFFLIGNFAFANSIDILSLRKLYYASVSEKTQSTNFLKIMESMDVASDPLLTSYKGMAYLLMANHCSNPYSKWNNFMKGKTLLEDAVQRNPWNIEIRFMRLCVQTNVPSFLGYSKNIESDKKFLLEQWKSMTDIDLKNKILQYMLDTKICNDSQKLTFK